MLQEGHLTIIFESLFKADDRIGDLSFTLFMQIMNLNFVVLKSTNQNQRQYEVTVNKFHQKLNKNLLKITQGHLIQSCVKGKAKNPLPNGVQLVKVLVFSLAL